MYNNGNISKITFASALQGLGNTLFTGVISPNYYPPSLNEHIVLNNETWRVVRIIHDYPNGEMRFIVERVLS